MIVGIVLSAMISADLVELPAHSHAGLNGVLEQGPDPVRMQQHAINFPKVEPFS